MVVKVSKPEINVREKISELDKPSGLAGQAMLAAETPQEQQALIGVGRRNLLINGNMEVNQRGYAGSYTSTGFQYTVDRWALGKNDVVNFTWEVDTFSDGFTDVPNGRGLIQYGLNSAGAGTDFVRLEQRIENVKTAAGQHVTLSFWARSATGSAFTLNHTAVPDAGAVGLMQYFGTGGSPSSIVYAPFASSITLSTEWTKYTYTTFVPDLSGKTIGTNGNDHVRLYVCNMDNDDVGKTIQITQLQLEIGKVATPFEHRSYGEELELCRRYYISYPYVDNSIGAVAYSPIAPGHVYSSNTIYCTFQYPKIMRGVPSFSSSGGFRVVYRNQSDGGGTLALLDVGQGSGLLRYVSNSSPFTLGEAAWISQNNDVDARVSLDAEL